MAEHELVIRGGTVVDGTGAPEVRADVAVGDGRITAVSREGGLDGARTIDAQGQVVTPGLIDLHSHADFSMEGHPEATTQIHQGVTTLLTGNCGTSPFPVGDVRQLQAATRFLAPEIGWQWRDASGFTGVVEEAGPAINLALQVGHSALRLAVMGEADRAPEPGELDSMRGLLRDAARDGVCGFSTGLIYAPGAFAGDDEVRALVAEAAAAGMLYSTHMRDESGALLDAVREAVRAAESTGARLEISHLKAMGPENHGMVAEALALIDAARDRGVDVTADVYPYTASSTTLTSRLPTWAMEGGGAGLLRRLADPAQRARVAAGLRARFGRDVDPEGVVLAKLPEGPYVDRTGSSIAEVGRSEGVDPAEAALRVLEAHQAAVSIVNHAMSEADVVTALRHPAVSVASDGWVLRPNGPGRPHPRNFGTFTRVLGSYVRETDALDLAEAVRKMTALPAQRLGRSDRGRLAPGLVADVAVFDPGTVTDHSTFSDPWRLSSGVSTVLVAGRPVLDEGRPTEERPGRVLRRASRDTAP